MMRLLAIALLWIAAATSALAQSSPGLVAGQVPTAGQWNSYFASKQDYNGVTQSVLATSPITVTYSSGVPTIACPTCLTTGSAVASVSNSDGTLTISPTTGSVVASLNLAHANTWTAAQIINLNAAAAPTTIATTVLQLVGADATAPRLVVDSIGTSVAPYFIGRQARGTGAAKTATQLSDSLALFGARGYGATQYSTGTIGYTLIGAAENFTDTAQGTYIAFATSPIGSVTATEKMRITDAGIVAIGTTTPWASAKLQVHAATDENLIVAGHSSLSDGVAIHALNDAISLNVGLEMRGSTVKLFASTGTLLFFTGSERMRIASTGFVNIGPGVTPDALLTVNANTVALTAGFTGTIAHFAGADTTNPRVLIDGFGGIGVLDFRRANGTAASPSAVLSADLIGAVRATGYGASAYNASTVAGMTFFAAENWTNSTTATYLTLNTTPTGSTALVERMRVASTGFVNIGPALTPDSLLTVNANTIASPIGNLGGTTIHSVGADSGNNRFQTEAYGGLNFHNAIRANGTAASPSALVADDFIWALSTGGYGTSTYIASATGRILIASGGTWTNTSTPTYIAFQTTASGSSSASERMRVNPDGKMLLGTTNTPTNASTIAPTIVVAGTGVNQGIQVVRYTNPGGGGSQFILSATRGSDVNSYTIVQTNDGLGSFVFAGADGAQYQNIGGIAGIVEGTPALNSVGGRLVFTTSSGSGATERLRMDSLGNILINTAAIATNATDGFLYIPTTAGTPTGTPTSYTGRIPMIYDTTNHQFWFYDSGWKQPKTPAGAATVTWQ